jgi:uncharacterized protein (DUF433 family)
MLDSKAALDGCARAEYKLMSTVLIEPVAVPLRQTEHGDLFIGDTRIPLEQVIDAWKEGETPEGIVESYDSLRLADVYAVLAYYLTHREQVDAYVRRQEAAAEAMRQKVEARWPPRPGFREELMARLAQREKTNDVAPGP